MRSASLKSLVLAQRTPYVRLAPFLDIASHLIIFLQSHNKYRMIFPFADLCITTIPICSWQEWFLVLSGAIGTILLIYSQFIEAENRRDLIRILGAGGLFVYAFFVENIIFMIATAGVGIAAFIEWIEIMMGVHKHLPEDLKSAIRKYKGMNK